MINLVHNYTSFIFELILLFLSLVNLGIYISILIKQYILKYNCNVIDSAYNRFKLFVLFNIYILLVYAIVYTYLLDFILR